MDFDRTTLIELVDRVMRSWWTIVAGVCLGATAGIVAMHFIPKVYEAWTKIFVSPQRIPQEYVRSTVVDDMSQRMAALEQAVLSRPYLVKLIENEFKPAPTQDDDLERLIATIRSKVAVQWYKGVFEISYRDVSPSRAANVVNTLADLYIQENSRYRAERAQGTTRALEELATRVRGELESQERRIADFKAAHLYETADRQQANLQMLNSRQKDLESKEADLASARDAVRMLAEMQDQPSPLSGAPSPAAGRTTGGAKVAALDRELKNLKLRYSDEHPQVKAKQRELDEARAAASKEAEALASAAPAEQVPSVDAAFKAQRSAMESEVRDLEADVRRIKAEIAMYEKRIEDTPRIEQQLGELTKGYDVLLGQYRDYQAKVQSAKGSQEMEQARMGEQFEVIERALPPVLPVWPKPMIILGLGIAAGLAAFVGPVVLRAFARPAISSEAGLRSLSPEIPVLVTVPRMPLPDTVVENRRRKLINLGLSTASVVVLAAALFALR